MTSNHLFFKAMWEDLRHKIWMIALSSLGSFLALPVAWLLTISDYTWNMDEIYYTHIIGAVFLGALLIAGGFVAIAGAVIVGLFGFRFVFHKNMIDTFHSIPIRRRTLYGVCWLNGFLIWLVPFAVCLLVTLGMGTAYLMGTPGRKWIPAMFAEAGVSFLALAVVFLLVYHVVLTAVMVSGNVLNTLASMMILGFGIISIYGLGLAFFTYYDTFYPAASGFEPALYASPLLSVIYLLYLRVNMDAAFWTFLFIDFCVMAVLGVLAWWLYQRRDSELAEQGIRNKAFSAVLKSLMGLAAGMGGWMLFYLIGSTPGWGIFGALLAGVLVFGVMDIIFSMEFKAFFAHKTQMAVTVAVSLATCLCFYGDLFGYDAYLPDKEDIAEIAVYDSDFSNRSSYRYGEIEQYMLENLHFQDVDVAYAYLERMTDREKRNGIVSSSINMEGDTYYNDRRIGILTTRITLKNGRTYFRNYTVSYQDLDVVWPLFSDQGYLEKNYVVDRQLAGSFNQIRRYHNGISRTAADLPEETMWAIAQAYNQDLLENPATVLLSQGILLAHLQFDRGSGFAYDWDTETPRSYNLWLDVYDSMEHTIAALEQLGYGDWVKRPDPDEVSEIRLFHSGSGNYSIYRSSQELLESVQYYYGVRAEGGAERLKEGVISVGTVVEAAEDDGDFLQYVDQSFDNLYLSVTGQAEIRELMQYLNNNTPWCAYNVFRKGYVAVEVVTSDGKDGDWYYIKRGELPAKYILEFEQIYEYLMQQRQ